MFPSFIVMLLAVIGAIVVFKIEDCRVNREAQKEQEKRERNAAFRIEMEKVKREKKDLEETHRIKEIVMVLDCSKEKADEVYKLLQDTFLVSEFDGATSIHQKRVVVRKANLFLSDGELYWDYFSNESEDLYRHISEEEKVCMIEKYIATGIDANSELLLKSIESEFNDPYELFGEDKLSDKTISKEDMKKILKCFSEKFGFEGKIDEQDRFSYNRYSLQLIWMYCIYFGYLKSLCDEKGSCFPCSTPMDFEIYLGLKSLFFDIVHHNIYNYKQVLRDHWDFLQEKIDECIENEEEEIQ